MSSYEVKILDIKQAALDTYCIKVERPDKYSFIPGQFTNLSIDTTDPANKKTLFCFTGLTDADYLEFFIKNNNNGNQIIKKIINSIIGEKIRIGEPQGNFKYKGTGTFIVAGTGITPVLSVFRDLRRKNDLAGNKLIYSNKTMEDIIQHSELFEMLDLNYVNLFTKQRYDGYYFGRIDDNFLKMHITDIKQYFYINGSSHFVKNILSILKNLNVPEDLIIIEEAILKEYRVTKS